MRHDEHFDAANRTSAAACCARCGQDDLTLRWQTFANGTRHIRVDCRHCGAYVRYAPQTAENVARADAAATTRFAS